MHPAAGGADLHIDAGARVDVVDPHRGGLAVGRGRHQPLLDGERAHAGEHVAAVGPRVDAGFLHADLGEKVVDVAAGMHRLRDDRHLAGQRIAAAQAVDLQFVGRAQRRDQRAVTRRGVAGQPVGEEERPPGGAATHQYARKVVAHGLAWCDAGCVL
ncbi:hypothetical protein D3C78_1278890 [compost metagenome]